MASNVRSLPWLSHSDHSMADSEPATVRLCVPRVASSAISSRTNRTHRPTASRASSPRASSPLVSPGPTPTGGDGEQRRASVPCVHAPETREERGGGGHDVTGGDEGGEGGRGARVAALRGRHEEERRVPRPKPRVRSTSQPRVRAPAGCSRRRIGPARRNVSRARALAASCGSASRASARLSAISPHDTGRSPSATKEGSHLRRRASSPLTDSAFSRLTRRITSSGTAPVLSLWTKGAGFGRASGGHMTTTILGGDRRN